MKKKLDLRNFGVILIKIIGVIVGIALILGVLYICYKTQIWNLPLGLIDLFKTERVTAVIFTVILLGTTIMAILLHRKSSGGFGG